MNVRLPCRLIFLFGLSLTALPAGTGFAAVEAAEIERLQQELVRSPENEEKAVLHKRLGDLFAAQGEYRQAAEEFLKALDLHAAGFSDAEKVQMAVYLSWAARYPESLTVLREVLARDPANREARVHLAKVLSWSGSLNEAGAEAAAVLAERPDDREALLVKANVLRWKGDARASIPYYQKALLQGEDFDARLGLAHAYLETGDKKAARESRQMLQPQYPYQEKGLRELASAFCTVRAAHADPGYSHYRDSEKNRVNRSALGYGFWAGQWNLLVRYRFTDAGDPGRSESAQEIAMGGSSRLGRFGAGAGLGLARFEAGTSLVTGYVRADAETALGSLGVSISREALTDTAQLIENTIMRTVAALGLTQKATARLTLSESYAHAGFSDQEKDAPGQTVPGNDSEDVRFAANYLLVAPYPRISAGYRFRYWDFRLRSGGGYFDPANFRSHQAYVSLYAEQRGWFASLEPSAGTQTFTRGERHRDDPFFGVTASAGWTNKRCTSFEINAEGGNYAGGTVAGFRYYLAGFTLKVFF
jgi:tetratricopeptide (TPR) repeat protein